MNKTIASLKNKQFSSLNQVKGGNDNGGGKGFRRDLTDRTVWYTGKAR